jgi:2-methylcitrate dehydratase
MLSTARRTFTSVQLPRHSNQALGIGQFAIDFLDGHYGDAVDKSVYHRVKLFHTDAVLCGISALAMRTNAPTLLRTEALHYQDAQGACVFGSSKRLSPEKAILANCAAVREWDSNGTVFGYNKKLPGHQAGEFGHNDFYAVAVAAAQMNSRIDGKKTLRAMLLSDEIRGRLAEVFSLKTYKIDHVVHGAIASAVVYGALMGATAEQIESAVGMLVSHYVPWRAIRAGKQLSDSKGASAAISTEAAILCMRRSMHGFLGPRDIFRNPESLFRYFVKTNGDSPFDLVLSHSGDDFSVMGMHFKLGLYEHQSAGAIQGVIDFIMNAPDLAKLVGEGGEAIKEIEITAYEPAFGIIGDPAKRTPTTRQSADHSMVFIVSRLLKKAADAAKTGTVFRNNDDVWKQLLLRPEDYGEEAMKCSTTRKLMNKIKFVHGGSEYDRKYPDGIPTKVDFVLADGSRKSSGLVMYPSGHARNTSANLEDILANKFQVLGRIALPESELKLFADRLNNLEALENKDLAEIYNFDWHKLVHHNPIDG